MDVLADRIGGRENLKVVEIERVRNEVCGVEFDAFFRPGANEKRFGQAVAVENRFYIPLEDGDASLRIVPAVFIYGESELNVGAFVGSRRRSQRAWICVGSAPCTEGNPFTRNRR